MIEVQQPQHSSQPDGGSVRPTWAKRSTKCNRCGNAIEPGTRRVDTYMRRNGRYFRLHYHYDEPPCFTNYINNWFKRNPDERIPGHGGRKGLNLEPEQKRRRHTLLSRLSAHYAYYLPLLSRVDPSNPTNKDIKRIIMFIQHRRTLISELEGLGGVPDKYRQPLSSELAKYATGGEDVAIA